MVVGGSTYLGVVVGGRVLRVVDGAITLIIAGIRVLVVVVAVVLEGAMV